MDKDKFQAMAKDLKDLISDYESCQSEVAKLTLKEMIIIFAKNLVKNYVGATSEKKSEMPCNCKRELYEVRKVG